MFRLYEAIKEKGITPHMSMYQMLAQSRNINNEYSVLLQDMEVSLGFLALCTFSPRSAAEQPMLYQSSLDKPFSYFTHPHIQANPIT